MFTRSTEDGRQRRVCPERLRQVLAGRWLWRSVLPVTGRCPHCKARIGPDALAIEFVTGARAGCRPRVVRLGADGDGLDHFTDDDEDERYALVLSVVPASVAQS